MSALRTLVVVCALASTAGAGEPQRPAGADARQRIESLEAHLDRAVARVSVPHPGILIGRAETTRGYRLPGYGILFVLTPRALPGDPTVFVLRRGGPGGTLQVPVPPPDDNDWTASIDDPAWQPEHVEEIERQVLVLQHVAEAERRAAEEDMDRIVRNVRVRLSPPPAGTTAPVASDAAESPDEAGDELELPAAPPWKFWFEAGPPAEERSPEQVVADVKKAVIEALESQAPRVAALRADEFVIVAVDFVPGGLFASHPRPDRTLVVRVRQKDLEACARGAMKPGDLGKRAEVFEY